MINFKHETDEMLVALKKADGYLDCENVVLQQIKKQISRGVAITDIDQFLEKLKQYFEEKTVQETEAADALHYRYAAGFLKTIIATPYWHRWAKHPIDLQKGK